MTVTDFRDARFAVAWMDEEPALTENARKVLEARYLKKSEQGTCEESAGSLFRRVANTIADVELSHGVGPADRLHWAHLFYRLMTSGDFMPNSPTLMNAGRDMGMLSACFVLPVRDSINDIFDSIKHTALIQKAGGGTGFAFDELRPTGDFIKSSGGTTSGPISFWRAFSEATNAIQQGAFRRGANMGMMYIHHPDILKFLHAKQDLNQFTNYNISVKITDAWMQEFNASPDSPHVVRNPRSGKCFLIPSDVDIWGYDVRSLRAIDCVEPLPPAAHGENPAYIHSPRLAGELPADLRAGFYTKRDIWNFILQNAWQTGEPGVVFIDRINDANPTPHVGRMEATNPCGEQPLLPYEACNLGSINLGNFIRHECTPHAHVDWVALRECVHLSTRFLDNVIDANNYPLPEIDHVCKHNRKIGLGIMGFADALYKLNVAYNSDAGVLWGERFMKFINDEAHNYSEHLARERGPFPNWKGSLWDTRHHRLMRNACTTTVAPTGTISIIANCSGGIEPMFSLAFFRNVLRGQKQGEKPLVEVNETFLRLASERGFHSPELIERIATEGTLAHIDGVPADVREVFVCAHDIEPVWHMRMQAGFQRHNDSSISKTINFPNSASVEQVDEIYRLAFELRCKGVTVYRDGCRNHQPMALKDSGKQHESHDAAAAKTAETQRSAASNAPADNAETVGKPSSDAVVPPVKRDDNGNGHSEPKAAAPAPARAALAAPAVVHAAGPAPVVAPVAPRIEPADLPEIVSGLRIRQMTPFGNMHVKITVDARSQRELEVFSQLGKGGDVATSDLEAICRMISLWLRAGGSLKHVIRQLEGIGSSLQIPTKSGRIMSLGDGLACALKKYQRAKERFGLRALLLGEIDPAELDAPRSPGAGTGSILDHPLGSSAAAAPAAHTPTQPARINGGGAGPAPAPDPVSRTATLDRGPRMSADARCSHSGGFAAETRITKPARDGRATPDTLQSAPRRSTAGEPAASSAMQAAAPRVADGRPQAAGSGNGHFATNGHATPQAGYAPSLGNGHSQGSGNGHVTEVIQASAEDAGAAYAALDALVLAQAEAVLEPGMQLSEETGAVAIATLPDDSPETFAGQNEAGRFEYGHSDEAVQAGFRDEAAAGFRGADDSAFGLAAIHDAPADADTVVEIDAVVEISAYHAPKHFHDSAEHFKVKCPECGGVLSLQEGCKLCHDCGWSAC